MSAADFGLGDLPLFHDVYCSADENVKQCTQGSIKVRNTHFAATLG